MSFCNTIQTPDGGSHENALKKFIDKINKNFWSKKSNQLKLLILIQSDFF